MILFRCPRCQQSYCVSDQQIGQKFACAGCGQRLQVPPPPQEIAGGLQHGSQRWLLWIFTFLLLPLVLAGLLVPLLMRGQHGGTADPPTAPALLSAGGKSSKPPATPAAGTADLAQAVYALFKTYCYRCHGENGTAEGGLNYILDLDKIKARRKVIPGKPDASRLYRRVAQGEMPPEEERRRPQAADIDLLRRWIAAGAPSMPAPTETLFLSTADMLEQMHACLLRLPERERRFTRFFTFTHLANAGLNRDELRTYRFALAKLVNSLSWQKEIVPPEPIDPQQTIFRIDLRHYGWSERLWERILGEYPYGILWDHPRAQACYELVGGQLPFVRGDWFVVQAWRPPLYHDILQLPTQETELVRELHMDLAENIHQERVVRAGFNGSGVSRNNRLIERHPSPYGYYWRSYDFIDNRDRHNIFAFPLGPAAPGAADSGFAPDGGEIIFSLPNGLNAFLLVNQHGQRLNKGPLTIVSDPRRPDRAVENGISCATCHVRGLIPKKDQVRLHVEHNAASFSPQELAAVQALYPSESTLQTWFDRDNRAFRQAVEKTGAAWTATEPAASLAAYFEQELDLKMASAELGLLPADFTRRLTASSPELRRCLGPLQVPGGTVQRQVFTEAIPLLVSEWQLGQLLSPPPLPARAGR
jgi:mono/diheme cytochrome c family protein/DNA-directed RNA polymerase subunit RPC12/RpoP